MTIEERLDKLEKWCASLESHIVSVDRRLTYTDKVEWIPVIDLPEEAKTKPPIPGHEYRQFRGHEKDGEKINNGK